MRLHFILSFISRPLEEATEMEVSRTWCLREEEGNSTSDDWRSSLKVTTKTDLMEAIEILANYSSEHNLFPDSKEEQQPVEEEKEEGDHGSSPERWLIPSLAVLLAVSLAANAAATLAVLLLKKSPASSEEDQEKAYAT